MQPSPDPYQVTTSAEISSILGEPPDFVVDKISDRVDESALAFVAASPLVFVATVDAEGRVDVSPKGDDPGFVHVVDSTTLLIPERKGNNLAYGPRNVLDTSRIGLIFVIPGQRETLRVNGSATLSIDPELLDRLAARDKHALMCTQVEVEECFFHCGKAMIRSNVWNPAAWAVDTAPLMASQVVNRLGGDPGLLPIVTAQIEQNYIDDL